ncbi:MAG: M15 family metallopeptidase [Saprospiraceae bacterium]|nr:M15 family metallopeptidase [Saprospiraceae bacterium]
MYKFISIILLLVIMGCAPENSNITLSSSLQKEVPQLDSSDVAYLTGRFDPAAHPLFEMIDIVHADRAGMYMRKEAYLAFKAMYEAAKKDGVDLVIRSAARNFDYQKGIWERKWTGQTILSNGQNAAQAYPDDSTRARRILEYSSMPGSSRHHWGTDVDFNSFDNSWFETGEGLQVFNWLEANASSYGFCRPYTIKNASRPYGYNEEKWHWSYVPLSKELTEKAALLDDSVFVGYLGDNTSKQIDILDHYILGINNDCNKHK